MRKHVFLLLLFGNIFSQADKSTYKKIEEVYLKSFSTSEDSSPPSNLEGSLLGIDMPKVNDIDQKKVVFDVLGKNSKSKHQKILNKEVWGDLEIFCSSGRRPWSHLFSMVDRTHTNIGRIRLAKILVSPTTDIAFLKKRQDAICELVDNVPLFQRLEKQIKALGKAEEQFLAFWKEDLFFQKLLHQNLYFKKFYFQGLNDNEYALEFLRRASITDPIWSTIEKLIIFSAIKHFVWDLVSEEINAGVEQTKYDLLRHHGPEGFIWAAEKYKYFKSWIGGEKYGSLLDGLSGFVAGIDFESLPDDRESLINEFEVNYTSAENYLKNRPDRLTLLKNEFNNFIHDTITLKDAKNLFEVIKGGGSDLVSLTGGDNSFNDAAKKSLTVALAAVGCCILALEVKSIGPKIAKEKERIALTNYLQLRLMEVSKFFTSLKNVHQEVVANLPLSSGLNGFKGLETMFGYIEGRSKKLKKFINLLSTSTFDGDASYFSFLGRVLLGYRLMFDVKEELGRYFAAIGEIDAYLSIARLYKEHRKTKANYCFPIYENEPKPHINLKDFWNPFIDPDKVITNNIELGGYFEPNNIIFTGPNAGGKSTILKSVTINLLFAQTLTIAPSSFMEFTPFTKINTYLNITDDIASGNSLFKAEVLRAQSLVKAVKSLKDNEFGFTIMDEMFSGTSPKEGEAASYAVTKSLGECENSMCIIATHFPMLTALEVDTNNFKNYKVSVKKREDGSLEYLHKIENGPSDQHIAFDILVDAGVIDFSVLGMAQDLLKSRNNDLEYGDLPKVISSQLDLPQPHTE